MDTKDLQQRLRSLERGYHPDSDEAADAIAKLEAERDALLVEVEGLRKDAERYRWLRANAAYRSSDGDDGPCLVCRDDDEDAAIDAAMLAGRQEG